MKNQFKNLGDQISETARSFKHCEETQGHEPIDRIWKSCSGVIWVETKCKNCNVILDSIPQQVLDGTWKVFESYPDAFDYCREANHPVIVYIAGQVKKLFPSGKAVTM